MTWRHPLAETVTVSTDKDRYDPGETMCGRLATPLGPMSPCGQGKPSRFCSAGRDRGPIRMEILNKVVQTPDMNIHGSLTACIFDVDGVLLASPHERAWRESLLGFAEPDRFTSSVYQTCVAGRPRMDGARAALEALGVPDATRQAVPYAERKQKRLEELIREGGVGAFPDALRFVQAIAALGWRIAAASSSKNANEMMQAVRLGGGSLFDIFSANVCGRDLPHGKPDPAIFLIAAEELHVEPANCFVAEDAPAGVEAARRGGMTALGIARNDDAASLQVAGANLVVTDFDEIAIDALADGRLCRRGHG